MGIYHEYMDFLLEKVATVGYKYLSEHDKKTLEKISKEEPIEIPMDYFDGPEWKPYPTPAQPYKKESDEQNI